MDRDLERIERRRGECNAELKRYRVRMIAIGFAVMALYVGVVILLMVQYGRFKAATRFDHQAVQARGTLSIAISAVMGLVAGTVAVGLFTRAYSARMAVRKNDEAVEHYARTVKWADAQGRAEDIPSADETLRDLIDAERLKESSRPDR